MKTEGYELLYSQEEGCFYSPEPPRFAPPFRGACRYLISLDYDGTLRQDHEAVSPAFFELMAAWRPHGVRWGINTGRSLHKLAAELRGFPFLPDFICTCERYAYLADAEGMLRPAAEHNAHCHRANMQLRAELLPTWQTFLSNMRAAAPALKWETAQDDPLSIEATDSATLDALMPAITSFARPCRHTAIQRAGRFMRLSDSRFTKGSALRCVQQSWQTPEHALFIMGDGHNDLDAFRLFPDAFCAAPANAHADVLKWLSRHGGYISPGSGVLEALLHWADLHHITEV